ncbi:MAG: hypothetical protein Q9160_006060 [Pyrenula sp. 1 TL-2023]
MKVDYDEEMVPIRQLSIYPLRFADSSYERRLEDRGRTFWSLRLRKFVSYPENAEQIFGNVDERYMVDMMTYKQMNPDSSYSKLHLRDDLTKSEWISDEPPPGKSSLLFPRPIPGYNLTEKKWVDLMVDRIVPITWNKQALKDLVVDDETKELVQALVMKQITAGASTDAIAGKGNGLIVLLHGAPGTGKTFTAEGVAEFAEKPLFRVTCGDIGTDAKGVERFLQAAFRLSKKWDCVVLLDEADVFLEERDISDLNRNALVAVFLRALEYHDGILILTSNRVGTFDEAFKSRIQLALPYENLTRGQRRKIWRNFMKRIEHLDAQSIDFDDVIDNIDQLSEPDMNGREIRNAITTARQLAQFKDERLRYKHLKHVINVSGKFSKYLIDLMDGMTGDELKRERRLRLTYQPTNRGRAQST